MLQKIKSYLPFLGWFPSYNRTMWFEDGKASFTTAMILIPQGMAYAMIAGLPPIYGLYSAFIPLLVYGFLGTSKQLSIGPMAILALMVSSSIANLTQENPATYLSYTLLLTFFVGSWQIVFGLFRLGFVTQFLSNPVLCGFTSAVALLVSLSQVKALFNIPIPSGASIFQIIHWIAKQFHQIHWLTFGIGISGLLLLILLKRMVPKWPRSILVVVLFSGMAFLLNFQSKGVHLLGSIPSGWPSFQWISFSSPHWKNLLQSSFSIAILGFFLSITVAKEFAKNDSKSLEPNQELLAMGFSNLLGSFFQSFPVTGSLSRTAINADSGAKTPMSSILAGGIVGITLLLFTSWFQFLPLSILAAIIIASVYPLIRFQDLFYLWKLKKSESLAWVVTFLCTLLLGVELGLFLGVLSSIVFFLHETMRPNISLLGKLPKTDWILPLKEYPEAETIPGLLMLRVDARFYFGNISYVRDFVEEACKKAETPIEAVLVDAIGINSLDSSAENGLRELILDLQSRNILFYLVHTKEAVKKMIEMSSLQPLFETQLNFQSWPQAIDSALKKNQIQRKEP